MHARPAGSAPWAARWTCAPIAAVVVYTTVSAEIRSPVSFNFGLCNLHMNPCKTKIYSTYLQGIP